MSLPVVLYTNPNFQRSDLSLPVIERLSHIPNIRYIKDASYNTGRLLWNLNLAFAKHNLAACIKGGLQLQGYAVGDPLPPQAPLSPVGTEEVRRALISIGALRQAVANP